MESLCVTSCFHAYVITPEQNKRYLKVSTRAVLLLCLMFFCAMFQGVDFLVGPSFRIYT